MCPPGYQLEQLFRSDKGINYKALLRQIVAEIPSSQPEKSFGAGLREKLRRVGNESLDAGLLMASMLYNRAYDLPFIPDLGRIPGFFIGDFLHYMTNPVLLFTEQGEEERYIAYMEKWISYLHKHITGDKSVPFWEQVAEFFVANSDFGPLYFSDANLVKLYTMRGDIIEHFLLINVHGTDYSFQYDAHRKDEQIRIGILAKHFTPHPETFAALPVYEHLGPDFRVILYSFNSVESDVQDYCHSHAHELKVLPQQLDLQVMTVRDDDLDILFVATNVTSKVNQACLLAAHRLARRQISGVGSVTTTGLRNVDYYLTGKLTDNPGNSVQYRESLLWMPGPAHCFSYCGSNNYAVENVTRHELGIKEDAIVYMSGSNMFKILPELGHSWAVILKEVPDSVLMLYPYGPNWSADYPRQEFTCRIQGIFRKCGIASSRLVILDPQPVPDRNQIMEYVKLGDIYLDSFPFSGTTSLIEPLGLGKPVITRQGRTFRTSMGAALLKSISMEKLIASSVSDYIQIATELGDDHELRKRLGDIIMAAMNNNPPFLNSELYSGNVANIFRNPVYKAIESGQDV